MVLRVCALGAAVVLFATGIVLRDLEAITIGLLLLGGVALLRLRGGLLGRVALALLFVDVLGWMAPAAWSNAVHGGALSTLAIPLALVASCAAGLAAAAHMPDRQVVIGGAVLLAVALVVSVLPWTGDAVAIPEPSSPSVAMLTARGAKFSSDLNAAGPTVVVVFRNKDLFWHTFTIDQLKLSIKAPLGGTRVARFNAPAGTYQFYCAVPGHKAAGMTGTLTVS